MAFYRLRIWSNGRAAEAKQRESIMGDVKKWGAEDFWGLGYEFDPQWLLTPAQQEIQDLTDKQIARVDSIVVAKEADIMEV